MSCAEMRDRMLEAPPEALAGADDSALARHLGACEACRARADRILAATRALADAIDAMGPTPSADEAVRSALGRRARARSRRGPGAWIAIPLAAAAAVAGLLLLDGGPRPGAPGATSLPDRAAVEPGFRIDVPPDRRVAVFETPDPEIRVVWFY